VASASVQDEENLAAIGRTLVDDVRRLVQLEIELAKAQMLQTLKRTLVGTGLIFVALTFLLLALSYAIGALPEGLGALNHWWGWLATGGALVLLAGFVGFLGYRRIRKGIGTAQTAMESIKGDAAWLKQLTKRNGSEI
jgi:hypothetical protein